MIYAIPIIILILQLALMIFCLDKLSKQVITRYLSKPLWAFIIIFGALFGEMVYLLMEKE